MALGWLDMDPNLRPSLPRGLPGSRGVLSKAENLPHKCLGCPPVLADTGMTTGPLDRVAAGLKSAQMLFCSGFQFLREYCMNLRSKQGPHTSPILNIGCAARHNFVLCCQSRNYSHEAITCDKCNYEPPVKPGIVHRQASGSLQQAQ